MNSSKSCDARVRAVGVFAALSTLHAGARMDVARAAILTAGRRGGGDARVRINASYEALVRMGAAPR